MTQAHQDLFAEAKEKYTIFDLWPMLRLPGEPRRSCKSPFREERTPSFSIHHEGKCWTDHATGEGGDVVEFIRAALGGTHADVREWLGERLGIDYHDHHEPRKPKPTPKEPDKRIAWPCELLEGTIETWTAFAKRRGYGYPAVHAMVSTGILRFGIVNGAKCFIVTDDTRRAAEIRRIDGQLFGESKAYPLTGVNKSWWPGLSWLEGCPKYTGLILVEGATDMLAAVDLYSRYRRHHGGNRSWQPVAVLGASCKNLHPDALRMIRGRYIRIIPDADPAGDQMADHWTEYLTAHGCTVDCVDVPRGTDLSENLNSIHPPDLFQ